MRLASVVLSGACLGTISGCSLFTTGGNYAHVYRPTTIGAQTNDPTGNPAPQSLVVDAYERVLIGTRKIPYRADGAASEAGSAVAVCAEPSPDVYGAIGVSQGLQAALAKGADPTTLNASGAMNFALSETGAQLGRAATIQLLRDKMFSACLAFANGGMLPYQYYRMLASTGEASVVLQAVNGLVDNTTALAGSITASAPALPGSSSTPSAASKPDKAASANDAAASAPGKGASAPANGASAPGGDSGGKKASLDVRQSDVRAQLQKASLRMNDVELQGRLIPVAAATAASAAASGPINGTKNGSKANKKSNTAAKPASSASAVDQGAADAKAKSTPTSQAIVAVQYLTVKYIISTAFHDCMDYYVIVAQTKEPAEPGLEKFCGAIVTSLLASPDPAVEKKNQDNPAPTGQTQPSTTPGVDPANGGAAQQTHVAQPKNSPLLGTPDPANQDFSFKLGFVDLGAAVNAPVTVKARRQQAAASAAEAARQASALAKSAQDAAAAATAAADKAAAAAAAASAALIDR